MINTLMSEMIKYYAGDPKRIQHFIKVHSFSKLIGELEEVPSDVLEQLEAAALVHDIGIKLCEEKYGNCNGKLQEKEGPEAARQLLERVGYSTKIIDRVCYLVGHHHTYNEITGQDYQILVEADFLVNMYEDQLEEKAVKIAFEKIFKTKSGKKICREMFL